VLTTLLSGVAPALFIAALVRRRAILPPALRVSSRPVLAGALVLAGVEIWIFVADAILGPFDTTRTPSWTLRPSLDVLRFGLVAAVIVASDMRRRRSVGRPGSPGTIDLAQIAHLSSAEAAVGTEMGSVREHRRLAAEAATARVLGLQHELLGVQDRARCRLERDLHDAVQQRLVALALQAALAGRREASGSDRDAELRAALSGAIDDAVEWVREIVDVGRPVVLDEGLVAALASLAASVPVAIDIDATGDLTSEDEAALPLWFAASEAITNALKHGQASRIVVRLVVSDELVALSIVDDGRGGFCGEPTSVVSRLAALDAHVETAPSEFPTGTTVILTVRRRQKTLVGRDLGGTAASIGSGPQ
jgi:signal transduction histidine kinase